MDEPSFKILYRSPESRMVGIEDLLSSMDRESIHKSVIFGFPWKKQEYFQRHNDYIIESVEKAPDRLVGFCCFDILSQGIAEEVERCLKLGLSGVGELALYGIDFTPEIISDMKDIMDLCAEKNAPVLIHTNEPVGHQYPGKQPLTLARIYDLIKLYPENRIILAHWGGGLFFFSLMKKEVKDTLKNTWFDTAASPYLYKPEIYKIACSIIGSEKILFGSDYPLLPPARYFKEMEKAGLQEDFLKNIKGENAIQLLERKK